MQKFTVAISILLLASVSIQATTIHVPADQPTIQAGIDAASAGDTVLVAEGTYYESSIVLKSDLILQGECGESICVTIDGNGQEQLLIVSNDDNVIVNGISFTNGYAMGEWPEAYGGGIFVYMSSLVLANCAITNCHAYQGGGIFCHESDLIVESCQISSNSSSGVASGIWARNSNVSLHDCRITHNTTSSAGGGFHLHTSSDELACNVELVDCVIADNQGGNGGGGIISLSGSMQSGRIQGCEILRNQALSELGGGLSLVGNIEILDTTFANNSAIMGGALELSAVVGGISQCTFASNYGEIGSVIRYMHEDTDFGISDCILTSNMGGPVIIRSSGSCVPHVSCTDIWGNEGGDWLELISDQAEINGNISEDPLFCDPDNGDFHLRNDSPCAPDNNDCGLMGAWPVGCSTSTSNLTWSAMKTLY